VIGVLPADVRFTQRPSELLLPMQPNRARSMAGILGENGIARLRAGVSLTAANADVERVIPIYYATFPRLPGTEDDNSTPTCSRSRTHSFAISTTWSGL
jgi:hypothetical protein